MKTDLERVISKLKEFRDVHVKVDSPDTPSGITWVDARIGPIDFTIEYRPRDGFGLHLKDETSYGSGPDEIYRDVDVLLNRLQKIIFVGASHRKDAGISPEHRSTDAPAASPSDGGDEERSSEIGIQESQPITKERLKLRELREILGITQKQLAKILGQQQSSISKFESRDDVLLSSLISWINGLGGVLEIKAHFKQCDLPLFTGVSSGKNIGLGGEYGTSIFVGRKGERYDAQDEGSAPEKAFPAEDLQKLVLKDIAAHTLGDDVLNSFSKLNLEADSPAEKFVRLSLSKLLDVTTPLKLKRLDTDVLFQVDEQRYKLDGLGYSDQAVYIIECKSNVSAQDLLEVTYEIDRFAEIYMKFLNKVGSQMDVRKLLIVPDGITECGALRSVAVLRYDVRTGRFTNLNQLIEEFGEWDLKVI